MKKKEKKKFYNLLILTHFYIAELADQSYGKIFAYPKFRGVFFFFVVTSAYDDIPIIGYTRPDER